jgi:hypothetical protein
MAPSFSKCGASSKSGAIQPSATDRFKALYAQLGDDAVDSAEQIDATIEALCLLQLT